MVDTGDCLILGCTDSRQAAFDAEATVNDGSCPVFLGCTDSTAATFRALATVDDGTCKYAGCRDPRAINYASAATLDGGGCVAAIPGCTVVAADNHRPLANLLVTSGVGRCERGGCTDALAPNFGANLTYGDGSCAWYAVGCTDPNADNYRSIALHDDGSCVVSSPPPPLPPSPKPPPPPGMPPGVPCSSAFGYELLWQEEGGGLFQGRIVAHPWSAHQAIVLELPSCASCLLLYTLGDGDATLVSLRAGWAYFTLGGGEDANQQYVEFVGRRNAQEPAPTTAQVSCEYAPPRPPTPPPQPPPAGRRLASGGSDGCTYASASNFDSAATQNDGSCAWLVVGCADSDALTFARDAAVHDASACVYTSDIIVGCLAPTAANYDSAAQRSQVSLCAFERIGCADPAASNYASDTTVEAAPGEAGSCAYYPSVVGLLDAADELESPDGGSVVYAGCTIPAAVNFAPAATVDDGSCVLPTAGCADSAALNFAPDVTIDDGSCVPLRLGCLLPSASNFDADATRDDGTCNVLTPPPGSPPPPPQTPPRPPPPPPSPPMPTRPPPACFWREELRPCTGLVADAAVASAVECEVACCADDACHAWQFDIVGSSSVCSRGTPGLCSNSLGRPQQHGGVKLDADAANATAAGPPPPGTASTGEVALGMGTIELALTLLSTALLIGFAVLGACCYMRARRGWDAYPRVAPNRPAAAFAAVVPNAAVGVAAGQRGAPLAPKRPLADVVQALTTPVRVAPSLHGSSGDVEFIQERIRRPAARPAGAGVVRLGRYV